jgi:hypothetical protein
VDPQSRSNSQSGRVRLLIVCNCFASPAAAEAADEVRRDRHIAVAGHVLQQLLVGVLRIAVRPCGMQFCTGALDTRMWTAALPLHARRFDTTRDAVGMTTLSLHAHDRAIGISSAAPDGGKKEPTQNR